MAKTIDIPAKIEKSLLKPAQHRRISALQEARSVLSATFFGSSAAPNVDDLLRVAEYILEG